MATLVAPVAREARRDDDRRPGSVGGGVAQHVRDPVGRHRDDDQVDRTVDVGQAADGRQPVDDVGLRVHHVHGAGVAAELRIASSTPCPNPPADRRTPTTATLAGCSNGRSDRAAARHSRWSAASTASRRRRCAARPPPRPATVRRVAREPGRAEDAQHAVVVAEDLRLEAADPVPPAERGEVLEEQAAQAPAAVLVGDQERDLGGAGGEQLGGRQAGDPATHERHQGRRRGVVGSEEVVDVAPTGLRLGEKKRSRSVSTRHRLVQPEHGVAVVLAQRPDHRDRPVGEQHVRGLRAPVPGGEGRSRLVGHVPNVPERAAACHRPGPPIRGVPRHG